MTGHRPSLNVQIAPAFEDLLVPDKYKYLTYYGGRGSAKSWSVAKALICRAHTQKIRVGCFRETQASIADSVHRLLCDQIENIGLHNWFDITDRAIVSKVTRSPFIFKGLRHNVTEIKSTEGLNVAWVEEAQLVSAYSWEILVPTIRAEGAQIITTYNPIEVTDATHQKFVVRKPPPRSLIRKVGWQDNPWFPKELEEERQYMLEVDPDAYQHIWEGGCRVISEAVIFKGRYVVESFETPSGARFYHGVDWGFANDPTVMMRCYVTEEKDGEHLWIDQESYGLGVELDELGQLFGAIETSKTWPIKADNARPETISYMAKRFSIKGAEKWEGSVEDGITHLKGFRKIHIHPRCKHAAEEARLYSFKVDKNGDILPVIVDKHNHCWDAIRYSLDGFIKKRGKGDLWERLAKR